MRREPLALQDIDCTMSPNFKLSLEAPASISQTLTVKSPDPVARIFSAAGLKSVYPIFLGECAMSKQSIVAGDQVDSLRMTTQLTHRGNILDIIRAHIRTDREILRHSPEEDLIATRNQSVSFSPSIMRHL